MVPAIARAAMLGVLALGVAASPALADPVVDGEFPVAGLDGNNKLTAGPDGNIWVTVSDGLNDVARITPAGDVTAFDLGVSGASGIASDSGGNLWITESGGVTKFSPGDPAGRTTTAIPEVTGNAPIVLGPDGNLWVATAGNLVRIPPANPTGRTVIPVAGLGPRDIDVAGSLLAVADFGGERVITATADAAPVITPYLLAGGPQGVAGSPNGQVAFTQPTNEPKQVGLFTPPGLPVTSELPGADPFGIALGGDGAYWSAESNGDRLVRLTPDNQVTFLAGFSAGSRPTQIAPGPSDTLWVTLAMSGRVARVSGVEPPPTPVPISNSIQPQTRIVKGPKKRVRTKRKRAPVKFRFRSNVKGARFECALARLKAARRGKRVAPKRRFKPCRSPRKYKLRPGKYRFWVRAVIGEVRDPTPAKRTFRVIRRR